MTITAPDQISIENVDEVVDSLVQPAYDCSEQEFDAHLSVENELHAEAMKNLDKDMGIKPDADQFSSRRP